MQKNSLTASFAVLNPTDMIVKIGLYTCLTVCILSTRFKIQF